MGVNLLNDIVTYLQEMNSWLFAAIILVPFFGTLILVPWLVVRIPADYFLDRKRQPLWRTGQFVPWQILLLVLKNILGMAIVMMGIAMLVLPGQGLLTILIGLLLVNFPGKFQCERWLVSRRPVLKSINWMRHKVGKEKLLIDNQSD